MAFDPGAVHPTSRDSAIKTTNVEARPIPRDEVDLARFGKRQQLRRNFRMTPVVGLTCTLMITWEGMLSSLYVSLLNGGPAGLLFGFLYVWIGNLLQVTVMAEMGSMIPLAGGQYNWVSILSPPSSSKFLSYFTGWLDFLTWQFSLASTCYLGGTIIQGLLVVNYPDYVYERWQGTLLFYAILALAVLVNTYLARLLPHIESLVLMVHILGFFAVLIPLVYLAPKSSASEVFGKFNNGGMWPTNGLSFFIGTNGPMFAFVGIDAATHMAEEIQNANRVIPYGMISSVVINGALGWGMVIAVLFCLGDFNQVLESTTQYPFIQVFVNAVGTNSGGTAIVSVVLVMCIFAAFGMLATSSRMMWAFAREKGLPFHAYLSKVEPRSALPLYAIGATVLVNMLIALINIASTAAFNAIVSLVVAGAYSAFIMASSALLHYRVTRPGSIAWGPFHLGRAGIPITIAALIYTIIGLFFSLWPSTPDPAPAIMNWSSLIFGSTILWSLLYWFIWGRQIYVGPIQEVVFEASEIMMR